MAKANAKATRVSAKLIDDDGEVRELTTADFKRMVPFSALPKDEQAMLRELVEQAKKRRQGERGKQVAPTGAHAATSRGLLPVSRRRDAVLDATV